MASAQVAPSVVVQLSYAGLARRVAAHLIDVVIAFAVMLASGLFMRWLSTVGVWHVPAPEGGVDPQSLWHAMTVGSQVAILVAFIVSMGPFYSGFFQASAWQATVGKRLLNIYVTDIAGGRIGLLRSLARSFAKSVFNITYLGAISVATIIAASKKQALHDYAAKTIVLNGRPPESGSPELWRVVGAFGIQFLWFVLTMLAVFRNLPQFQAWTTGKP
jgi:uncharacterized RDD family membrane protein YckC